MQQQENESTITKESLEDVPGEESMPQDEGNDMDIEKGRRNNQIRTVTATVHTMDKEVEFKISAKMNGKDFFRKVSEKLEINEYWYFGLMFYNEDNNEIWIDHSKKTLKSFKTNLSSLHYRVKCYPKYIGEYLIEDNTIRHFFFQVCNDILSETIYCPSDMLLLLASYVCQARFEDYNSDVHHIDFLRNQNILPKIIYTQYKMRPEKFLDIIINLWLEHSGMLKEEAMLEYLQLAGSLEMFGISYFKIANKNGSEFLFGVYAEGLNIYKLTNKMNPIIIFSWAEIRTIAYNDTLFITKLLDKKSKDLIFYTSRKNNKMILNIAMQNHQMSLGESQQPSQEIVQLRMKAIEKRKDLLERRNKLQTLKSSYEETGNSNQTATTSSAELTTLSTKLKIVREKLEISRDTTKETVMDITHKENIRDDSNKYKTFIEKTKIGIEERVDIFGDL